VNTAAAPAPKASRLGRILSGADDLAREQRNALVLLVGCLCTLLPHLWFLPTWIGALALALLALRGGLTLSNRPPLPKWPLFALAGVAAWGIWSQFGTLIGREAGVASLVLLTGAKLLEMRARRDLFVTVFLCFFLLFTQFLYGQTIPIFLLGLVAVVVLVFALTLFHSGSLPVRSLRLSLTDSFKMLLIAAPLALVVFYLFPRAASPLWGVPQSSQQARTGLSDSMSPGDVTRLAQNDAVVMRVEFPGGIPPNAQRYFRGPVLTQFDGRTWRPDTSFTALLPVRPPAPEEGATQVLQTITLEPQQTPWLFALEHPIALPALSGSTVTLTGDGLLLTSRPQTERVRYAVSSQPGGVWRAETDIDIEPILRQRYTNLPAGFNPRAMTWATELRNRIGVNVGDPQPFINALLAHIREQPYRYTLEPPALGRDSVDEFFFDTRAGFCEHYAQAFVVLMRAMDFPARVVTGYQGGDVNPVDGVLLVRQRDAHAWAEVWFAGRGWVRVDPTAAVAPSRVESGFGSVFPERAGATLGGFNAPDWVNRLRNWADAIDTAWSVWVVNYGGQTQRDLLGKLGIEDLDWQKILLWLLGLGTAAMALIWWLTRPRLPKPDEASRLMRSLRSTFEREGLAPEPAEPLSAWRKRIAAQLDARRLALLDRTISAIERALYGPLSTSEQAAAYREAQLGLRSLARKPR
jgi:transglutaminase-like putative cysteine protease